MGHNFQQLLKPGAMGGGGRCNIRSGQHHALNQIRRGCSAGFRIKFESLRVRWGNLRKGRTYLKYPHNLHLWSTQSESSHCLGRCRTRTVRHICLTSIPCKKSQTGEELLYCETIIVNTPSSLKSLPHVLLNKTHIDHVHGFLLLTLPKCMFACFYLIIVDRKTTTNKNHKTQNPSWWRVYIVMLANDWHIFTCAWDTSAHQRRSHNISMEIPQKGTNIYWIIHLFRNVICLFRVISWNLNHCYFCIIIICSINILN